MNDQKKVGIIAAAILVMFSLALILMVVQTEMQDDTYSPVIVTRERVVALVTDSEKIYWESNGPHFSVKIEARYDGIIATKEYTMADAYNLFNVELEGKSIAADLYTRRNIETDTVLDRWLELKGLY